MKVLVACEFSGIVREAFAARGHVAWSCDLLPTEQQGNHYQGDVRDILDDGWDLLIAHPPCTYLSAAGARWLYGGGAIDLERLEKGMEARYFFMELLNVDIPRIAVENPRQMKIFKLPQFSQEIQPYQFGESYSKATRLWLKGLPRLEPTEVCDDYSPLLPSNTGTGKRKGYKSHKGHIRQHNKKGAHEASRTFTGIAAAMAEQWG